MSFAKTTPYQKNIRPGFLGDYANREHVLPGGIKLAASTFNGADAVKVVVDTAGAAANANAVPVTALTAEIPAGTTISFGAAGSKKFAKTTALVSKGAVSLVVEALATALVAGDIGYYNAPGVTKRVPAGTLVGTTNAALEAGAATGVQWHAAVDADDVVRIMAYDSPDVDTNNDADVLRVGTLIRVNHLPVWATLSAALKAKVRATYEVTVGTPGQEVPAS